MLKLRLLTALSCLILSAHSQDFTNKGKEFWIGYGNHQVMYAGNTQGMDLYITSDVSTNVLVEIPGIGFSNVYAVAANQVTQVNIPNSAILDGHGLFNRGIHVVADKPVVVYAHIYFSSVSGASLCLPVPTLGREYYSVNFTQAAQGTVNANSYSYFFVVATEDATTVEIIPSVNTLMWGAGSVNTITLQKGQIYQVLANTDLTGSTIKSINTGTGCKKIAVFCGSGRIGIGCAPGTISSSDNLIQQMYPTGTWGKKYVTVPSVTRPRNYYRIIRPDPTATVRLDGGILLPGTFVNGLYREFVDDQPHVIESDKPILVAQYFTTQGCAEGTNNGDPEMIYLNPVEQTINKVTLTSMRLLNTSNNVHYINAIVRNSPGAVSTFRVDGISYSGSFITHPTEPNYVYAQIPVALGTHTITCDTPFNAIAYGFGNAESYGYSAGTNLKDLYQFVTIQNDYGTVNFPAGCKNSPFRFAMTFPYQPTVITWKFNGLFTDTTISSPVFDSSWVVDGRTLYRYRLSKSYVIPASGTYPITVIANNPTTDGCSGIQEIDYDLQIFDPPVSAFNYQHNGCISDSVRFFDNTNGLGRPLIRWFYDFGDGNISTQRDPVYKYNVAGNRLVRHSAITDVGCLSDTAQTWIPLSDPPVARFGISSPACANAAVTFTDSSTVTGGTLVRWIWDLGDNTTLSNTNNNPVQHVYTNPGTYTITLQVETNSGCRSFVSSRQLVIHPKPVANFNMPIVCLPVGAAQFNDVSTISDGTQSQFTYFWEFGDGITSTLANPLHNYSATGPFNVKLTVTSNNGCADDSVRIINTIYPQPKANFNVTPEVCLNDTTRFTDMSDGLGSTVTRWRWDFGDGSIDTVRNPVHRYLNPGTFPVRLFIYTDKGCISDTLPRTTIVNPLPSVNFLVSAPTCETRQVNFTDGSLVTGGTITRWTWTFGDNSTAITQHPTHIYGTVGNYPVTLLVESNKGCVSPLLTRQVAVTPLPATVFGLPEVCLSDPFAQFSDSSRIADGSESQFSYLWNFGDNNATAGNPNTSTMRNPQHRYTAVGIYDITLTVTSKDGCSTTVQKPFTVNGSIPRADFSVNNSNNLCSNQDMTILDASTVDFGSIVKVEVYWDYTNDPTIKLVDDDPRPGKTYVHRYPDFGTPATRTFQVRYVAYSGINCVHEFNRTITVNASPSIQFDPMNGVCEEIPAFQITAAREIYGFTGTGTFFGDGIVNPNGLFNPSFAKPGLHTIRYSFNAANGCNTYADQSIRVYPTPFVDAGPDRTVLEGGFGVLMGTGTGNNVSFLWSPNSTIDNNKTARPKISPSDDIYYTLLVTSADGCSASDEVFVKVLKEPKVPNAFTPNGDGINDTWVIQFLESYPGCTVDVYNRYGAKVYTSLGYGRAWDGTLKGTPLPVGTYYWIINPKNGRAQMNGSVTIIR